MIDERLVYLARNALIVAGMEMGKEGDHWPLIKANVHALMQDYERLKIETAVHEELKVHLGDILRRYEEVLPQCDEDVRQRYEPHVKELRDVYDAMFSPANPENETRIPEDDEGTTGYVPSKSSAMIIQQLTTGELTDGGK